MIFESIPENKMVEKDGKKKDAIGSNRQKGIVRWTVKRKYQGLWWGSQKSRAKF